MLHMQLAASVLYTIVCASWMQGSRQAISWKNYRRAIIESPQSTWSNSVKIFQISREKIDFLKQEYLGF
jgi:hypothetical protein